MATKNPTTLREEAARLQGVVKSHQEKIAELLGEADNQEAIFDLPVGTPVKAKRRSGDRVDALFQGAKDTERGILVAVQVGEGFDAELLRLPLSKVEVPATAQSTEATN